MIGPISVLASLNILIFISALCSSSDLKGAVSDFGNLKTLLWLNIVLLPLLGLNCMSALLTVNDFFDGFYILYYITPVITSIYVFISYCVVNRRVRFSLKITYWKLRGKNVTSHAIDESLSVTRVSLASRNASMFQSPFDIHRPTPARSIGVTSTSTTSRSTTTKGSSSQYDHYDHHHHHSHRHRKKRHRRRHHRHYKNSTYSESNPSLDLASSHSSDEDDGTSVGQSNQNEINSMIQRNLEENVNDNLVYSPQGHVNVTSPYGVIGVSPMSESTPRTYTRSSNLLTMTFVEGVEDSFIVPQHTTTGEPIYTQRLVSQTHPVIETTESSYLPSYQEILERRRRTELSIPEMTDEVDDEDEGKNEHYHQQQQHEDFEVKDQVEEREREKGEEYEEGTDSRIERDKPTTTMVESKVDDGGEDNNEEDTTTQERRGAEESSIIDTSPPLIPSSLTSTDV